MSLLEKACELLGVLEAHRRLTPDSMVEAVKASNARLGRAVDIAQMHAPRSLLLLWI